MEIMEAEDAWHRGLDVRDAATNLTAADAIAGGAEDEVEPVKLDNLYPALVECFGIILLGFVARKLNLISEVEAKGLGTFVSTFALPALVFGSLCKIQLGEVHWTFLLSILIAKSALFLLVVLGSFLVSRPANPAKAGLFAIFVTQSNDFALGYPILKAVYGASYPQIPMYLYLMAPISLVILNPLGFILMEIGRSEGQEQSLKAKAWNVAKGILGNPIIFMTALGVAGNFAFAGSLPQWLDQLLTTLGSAFSGCALFLLGLRMVGQSTSLSVSALLVPSVLIILKTLALPLIAREVSSVMCGAFGAASNETELYTDFAFLYGTFPSAPSVFVFAAKYEVAADLIASAMVACTFAAAPMMFVSARLLSITDIDPSKYIDALDNFLFDVSVAALLAVAWTAFTYVVNVKWPRLPHTLTFCLIISQGIGCVGAIMWSVMACTHGWKLYVQFVTFSFGVYSTRIFTALLAVTLLLLQIKPEIWVAHYKRHLVGFGFAAPAVLIAGLVLIVSVETEAHGAKKDPNFQYGPTQAYVALTLLVLCFLVTVVCLILAQRFRRSPSILLAPALSFGNSADDGATRRLLDATPTPSNTDEDEFPLASSSGTETRYESTARVRRPQESVVPIEDLMVNNPRNGNGATSAGSTEASRCGGGRYRCNSETRERCSGLISNYDVPPGVEAVDAECRPQPKDEIQLVQHTVFLVALSTSMFIGIALCVWTLVMETMTGIYLELVFLDGFLNFGQGLFSLAFFGFSADYITLPFRRLWRRVCYGADSIVVPAWEDLEHETKEHCRQFMRYHIDPCVAAIVKDVRVRLTSHKAVFKGNEMVDWLLEVGLARDRVDGVEYGRQLVKGRVIRHVANHLDFYDDCFLYTFKE